MTRLSFAGMLMVICFSGSPAQAQYGLRWRKVADKPASIANSVYSSGVKQRQAAIDRWRQRWSKPTVVAAAKKEKPVIVKALCPLLAKAQSRVQVKVYVKDPPRNLGQHWPKMSVDDRAAIYAELCGLSSSEKEKLYRALNPNLPDSEVLFKGTPPPASLPVELWKYCGFTVTGTMLGNLVPDTGQTKLTGVPFDKAPGRRSGCWKQIYLHNYEGDITDEAKPRFKRHIYFYDDRVEVKDLFECRTVSGTESTCLDLTFTYKEGVVSTVRQKWVGQSARTFDISPAALPAFVRERVDVVLQIWDNVKNPSNHMPHGQFSFFDPPPQKEVKALVDLPKTVLHPGGFIPPVVPVAQVQPGQALFAPKTAAKQKLTTEEKELPKKKGGPGQKIVHTVTEDDMVVLKRSVTFTEKRFGWSNDIYCPLGEGKSYHCYSMGAAYDKEGSQYTMNSFDWSIESAPFVDTVGDLWLKATGFEKFTDANSYSPKWQKPRPEKKFDSAPTLESLKQYSTPAWKVVYRPKPPPLDIPAVDKAALLKPGNPQLVLETFKGFAPDAPAGAKVVAGLDMKEPTKPQYPMIDALDFVVTRGDQILFRRHVTLATTGSVYYVTDHFFCDQKGMFVPCYQTTFSTTFKGQETYTGVRHGAQVYQGDGSASFYNYGPKASAKMVQRWVALPYAGATRTARFPFLGEAGFRPLLDRQARLARSDALFKPRAKPGETVKRYIRTRRNGLLEYIYYAVEKDEAVHFLRKVHLFPVKDDSPDLAYLFNVEDTLFCRKEGKVAPLRKVEYYYDRSRQSRIRWSTYRSACTPEDAFPSPK